MSLSNPSICRRCFANCCMSRYLSMTASRHLRLTTPILLSPLKGLTGPLYDRARHWPSPGGGRLLARFPFRKRPCSTCSATSALLYTIDTSTGGRPRRSAACPFRPAPIMKHLRFRRSIRSYRIRVVTNADSVTSRLDRRIPEWSWHQTLRFGSHEGAQIHKRRRKKRNPNEGLSYTNTLRALLRLLYMESTRLWISRSGWLPDGTPHCP